MRNKKKTLYMHTIEGHPAEFDGDQLVYHGGEIRRFAKSLAQIKREQRRSKTYRIEQGFHVLDSEYDYVRIKF